MSQEGSMSSTSEQKVDLSVNLISPRVVSNRRSLGLRRTRRTRANRANRQQRRRRRRHGGVSRRGAPPGGNNAVSGGHGGNPAVTSHTLRVTFVDKCGTRQVVPIEQLPRGARVHKLHVGLARKLTPSLNQPEVNIDKDEFIQTSAQKRVHYNKFPTLQDYATGKRAVESKVTQLTNEILAETPSGDPSNRDTLLHVLSGISSKPCLFFDSSRGINPTSSADRDLYLNAVDADDETAPKFVLKLKNLDGFLHADDAVTRGDDAKQDAADKVKELKEALQSDCYHPVIEAIRTCLAQAHTVSPERVVITDFYLNGVGAPYYIRDLTVEERERIKTDAAKLNKNMEELFPNYDTIAIHPALYHHMYDVSMFDERGNKTFSHAGVYKVGPPGNEKHYTQPAGWTRYGLKVLGKYSDDKWLTPFRDAGNWYRAYHGTDVNAGGWIVKTNFVKSTGREETFPDGKVRPTHAAWGEGVYCSPNIDSTAPYSKEVTVQTVQGPKTFQYALQVAVNPVNLNSTKTGGRDDYWVAPEPTDIRPYGILLKEKT